MCYSVGSSGTWGWDIWLSSGPSGGQIRAAGSLLFSLKCSMSKCCTWKTETWQERLLSLAFYCQLSRCFPFMHTEHEVSASLLYPFVVSPGILPALLHLCPCGVAYFQKGPGSEKLSGCREQHGEDQWLWDVPSAGWWRVFHRWGPQTDPCQMDGSWSPELR